MYTAYHSLYWATALTLRSSGGSLDRLSQSIANAKVDLNPHQVDAALFAVRSPLSKGAILADEVGLGKTIEAAIVIAQRWAERKRRILLILPATLRSQWQQELAEKFSLPTIILETRSFNLAKRNGQQNAFVQKDQIVICSYQFAAAKLAEVRSVPWDLVVIDEAHRLRNIYKGTNRTATAIAEATSHAPKILLTATPLQNSLMELYGLVSVIDPHVFGDANSFREQFVKSTNEIQRNIGLKDRLKPICTRTLRKQVLEYVRFTQRIPITQDFIPTDAEHELYELVSAYLQRPTLFALPVGQRNLITLILRKLLASSSFAIAGTLRTLVERLESIKAKAAAPPDDLAEEDFETKEEYEEEWSDDVDTEEVRKPEHDARLLQEEIGDLQRFLRLAQSVSVNAKGDALLKALETAFEKAVALGAARKAVIFTESRRTQKYLFELLTENGYGDQIVLINGTNTDEGSARTYERWLDRHRGTDVSGSRSADMKAALVEEFRDRATILIATESAAEGVNLQFCSLVVNYDLPWNPQRIEQRIGRCHRYGQKHDVVVVNFLNRRNAADQRVFQLLSEKFRLFDGIFGSSDEVLGALESGVDLEKRIAQVYQECRTPTEIEAAFDQLQAELDETIGTRLAETRRVLLENFDEEVHARMRVHREQALAALSTRQRWLLELTKQELGTDAAFDDSAPRFAYSGNVAPPGAYNFDWKAAEERGEHFYRLGAALADAVIATALERRLPPAALEFRYSDHGSKMSVLEALVGRTGWLQANLLTVTSLDAEEHLILSGCDKDGAPIDDEIASKLLSLRANVSANADNDAAPRDRLRELIDGRTSSILEDVEKRNGKHFDEEVIKLDRWADDLKLGLEREIKEIDQQIRDTRRLASAAAGLAEKLARQKEVKALEVRRNSKRRELFDAQDDIDKRRDGLIGEIEAQLKQTTDLKPLFTIRWSVV